MRNYLLFFLLVAFAGCQKQTAPPQLLRLNFHSEPASFDPRLCRDLPAMTLCRMLYEGLFRPHESGAQPALVHNVKISEDALTYTFELRSACWTDGQLVTAGDFVQAWTSVLSPHFPAEAASHLFIIQGAKEAKCGLIPPQEIGVWAEGTNILKVKLKHPDPYFFERLCHPVTFPIPSHRANFEKNWTKHPAKDLICNGPFRLKEIMHGDHLKVEKNPFYWDRDAVRLSGILITLVEDEHTELNMYENGELDWAGSPNSTIPPEAIPTLQMENSQQLFIEPLSSTYCYKFNTKSPPFNNANIRAAFALSIEKQSLIDNILQAGQLVAYSLIPPHLGIKQETLPLLDPTPLALFEKGLQEMGWTRQSIPPVTLIFSKSEKHQKIAQAVQQQWSQMFGIKISLQSYEWNIFLDKLAQGDYQVGGRGWISEITDPKSFLEIYQYDNAHKLGAGNDTGWEDEEFCRLLDTAEKTSDVVERVRCLEQAQHRLLTSFVIVPVYHSTACFLKNEHLKGFFINAQCDLDFKSAYFE